MPNSESRILNKYFWWLLFFLLVSTFWFVAVQHGQSLASLPAPNGFHGAQADALLHGRLYLFEAPKELLELDDPYDPVANKFFRDAGGHDLALFGDKIYSVHNFGPAIFLHIPYRLLGLGNLNPRLSVLISSIAASFLLCKLIDRMLENRRQLSPGYWLACLYLISLVSPLLWLVSIGRAYEESISLGQAFLLGGLCLLLPRQSCLDPDVRTFRPSRTFFGLCIIALAGLSRPSLLVCLPVICVWIFFQLPERRILRRLRSMVLVTSGALLVVAVISLVNWYRFDAFGHFGNTFQLAGMNMRQYQTGGAGYLLPNLADYLFAMPRIVTEWPFLRLAASTFKDNPNEHSHEPIVGFLVLYPHLAVMTAFAQSAIPRRRLGQLRTTHAAVGSLLLSLAAITLLVTAYPFNSATMRYEGDFVPLFLAGSLTLSFNSARQSKRWTRLILVPLLFSAALMWSFSLTNCSGTGSC